MKLQVNANDEMVKKLDMYAEKMSVSRSALCGMLIGHGLLGLDRSCAMVDDLSARLLELVGAGQMPSVDAGDILKQLGASQLK